MIVRISLWNVADSDTGLDELRRDLLEESVAAFARVDGLLFGAWVSNAHAERFGSIELFDSRDAADQPLPGRARQLIGKDPDLVEEFDLEATVSIASQLNELGLAFA